MVENVKRKRVKSWWLLVVIAGLAVMAAVIWVAFFMNRSYDPDARAYVDGRIETGSNAVDQAVSELDNSEPADVIRDRADADENRIALVFVGMTGEADTDTAVIDLLKENGIKASFALSASEALAETDFVDELLDSGCELISNGTDGESNIHTKSAHDMVEIMLKSRESISASADISVPILYCSSTEITSDVLRAASVGGYDAVVDTETANVLDINSFKEENELDQFISSLSGDTVVAVDLRGENEEIADESAVTAEKPAVDKQPDADSADDAADEPVTVLTQVEWIVRSINNRNMTAEYVSSFERTDGSELLREQMNDPDSELAVVWRYALTDQKTAGIGMRGMPEGESLNELLSALKKNKTEITFFMTSDEMRNRSDDIERVRAAGCTVGVTENVADLTRDQVYDVMRDSAAELRKYTEGARLYLADDNNLAAVRTAARLLGMRVIKPDEPETPFAGAFYMLSDTDAAVISELNKSIKKEGLRMTDIQSVVSNAGNVAVLSAKELNAARRKNDHTMADVQKMVYTTERSAAMMFFNADNENAVRDSVDHLKANNGTGTFFMTLDELTAHASVIEYILQNGNELGISYRSDSNYPQTFDSVMNYLNTWRRYAEWRYGADVNVVYMPSDEPSDETREAVKISGCRIIRNTFLVVKNEDKDITADDIPTAMERINDMRVMRGSFTGFNMSFYENDKYAEKGQTILGSIIDAFMSQHIDSLAYHDPDGVIEDGSRFKICTVSSILDSDEKYTFCYDKQEDITLDKNVLTDLKTDEERFDVIAKGYYGNVTVDVADKLPGFNRDEIKKLDKSGTFTDDKVLFLTFDDWGTEQSINELLYVLQKHNVKGTFFVKTQYVDSNPNLLRAIAVQGHQIASHTDGHIPLADSDPKNENKMYSLTDEEAKAMRSDLVLSYDKLYKYTGDVTVDGKKALTPMFRPPTLAVSKIGISQVFDVGYKYSISGAYSTGDYEASSLRDMISRLTRRRIGDHKYIKVQNGTVLVMHMQENAKYTAQALDEMIPVWEQEGYRFARIDDYLSY